MNNPAPFIDLEDGGADPRSSIPNDLKVMRLKVKDLHDALVNPIAAQTLADNLAALDAIAVDIEILMNEVSND